MDNPPLRMDLGWTSFIRIPFIFSKSAEFLTVPSQPPGHGEGLALNDAIEVRRAVVWAEVRPG